MITEGSIEVNSTILGVRVILKEAFKKVYVLFQVKLVVSEES